LFKRVTGLDVKDFELLVSLGVFNGGLMNDAVYKFKRYEDSSLSYTGIDKHEGGAVGGYDTVLTREEYERLFGSQQMSISEVKQVFDDIPDVEVTEDDDYDDEDDVYDDVPVEKPKPASKTRNGPVITRTAPDVQTSQFKPTPSITAQPPPLKPRIDLSGVKVGTQIKHKTFGDGVIVSFERDLILVSFGKEEKKFQFPQAFENGFLRTE